MDYSVFFFDLLNVFYLYSGIILSPNHKVYIYYNTYRFNQNKPSGGYHTYVLNEFLTVDRSFTHILRFFWHLWVQIGQLVEAQWNFKLSEEIEIDIFFLRKQQFYRFHTFIKDWLTNLDAKGAKRSVNMWATNFYKVFSKIVCGAWTVGCQKFIQCSTYVWSKVDSCFCEFL